VEQEIIVVVVVLDQKMLHVQITQLLKLVHLHSITIILLVHRSLVLHLEHVVQMEHVQTIIHLQLVSLEEVHGKEMQLLVQLVTFVGHVVQIVSVSITLLHLIVRRFLVPVSFKEMLLFVQQLVDVEHVVVLVMDVPTLLILLNVLE
jgi:hypothetical protein